MIDSDAYIYPSDSDLGILTPKQEAMIEEEERLAEERLEASLEGWARLIESKPGISLCCDVPLDGEICTECQEKDERDPQWIHENVGEYYE